MIWNASVAIAKNYDFETLKYSDYMYGHEDLTDEVYEFVIEARNIGTIAFYEKYSEYNLY